MSEPTDEWNHRATILSPQRYAGVGIAIKKDELTAVQEFSDAEVPE